MAFTSEVTPFPRRTRVYGTSTPKVRPIMKLEWNKLLAEATEKDTEAGNEFGAEDSDCDGNDCTPDNTEECGDTAVNRENETESNVPLNLCYKANTMPSLNISDQNVVDHSSEKKGFASSNFKSCPPSKKSISCTVPNLNSYNVNQFSSNRNQYYEQVSNQNNNSENILDNNNGSKHIISCQNISYQEKSIIQHTELGVSCLDNKENILDIEKPFIFQQRSQCSDGVNKENEKTPNPVCNLNTDVEQGSALEQKSAQYSSSNNRPSEGFAVPAAPAKLRDGSRTLVVNRKSYQVLAPIGKGGSSKVYLVLSKENELLAVKCVRLSDVDENIKNDYLNEIQHLLKMQHSKHVIRLYDHQYVSSRKLLYAVMERGDTDLSRFLKDKATSDEGISPELIMYYWTEMLLAVKSIHDNNIIHRDLKPANFLLVSGRLKLIDFGIASSIQTEQTSILMETQSGTFNYMSPEALQDLGSGEETILRIGRKTDVWSLGCILYYFIYKKTPYQEFVKPQLKMRAITDPRHVVKFPKIPGVPEVLIESCKRCLIHDKNKRASIEELIELRNQPLLSLSQVMRKLRVSLTPDEYEKASKALTEDDDW